MSKSKSNSVKCKRFSEKLKSKRIWRFSWKRYFI